MAILVYRHFFLQIMTGKCTKTRLACVTREPVMQYMGNKYCIIIVTVRAHCNYYLAIESFGSWERKVCM